MRRPDRNALSGRASPDRRYGPREPRRCKLDPYKDFLQLRVQQARPRWIPATVLWRELRERGYDGGITQLRDWLAPLRRIEPEPIVRFKTPPGKQMQADFTTVRRGRDPLIALVATMGYSRATFVKFVVPLAVQASGLKLDVVTANVHVRRRLDEVANARVHATTKAVPASRLHEERATMLPAPALKASPRIPHRVALPTESLQHPLSIYDELLEARV